MLPPVRTDEVCCPGSSHVYRFLPIPETDAEREIIRDYGEAAESWWTDEEIHEAARRLMDGPTPENWAWVRAAPDRALDASWPT
jgi:hypothetical protein